MEYITAELVPSLDKSSYRNVAFCPLSSFLKKLGTGKPADGRSPTAGTSNTYAFDRKTGSVAAVPMDDARTFGLLLLPRYGDEKDLGDTIITDARQQLR
jgi:hypothetical protein